MRTLSFIGILCIALLAACASAPRATLRDDIAAPPETSARIIQNRLVLRALGSSPLSESVRKELRLATQWLDRAEGLIAQPDEDAARVSLLLDAAEGQLVMLKTYFDRRAAEEASGIAQPPLADSHGEQN